MIFWILLLGLILRLINLNQSLWLDEAINVLATQNFSLLGMITEYSSADFHPPLFFIIIWLWTKAFGISEIAVRIPSVIFGVSTVYMIYLIGNKLHSKTLGLLSALLLAINPLHIYYSQEARMYALVALAVAVNFLIILKFIKKEINLFALVFANIFVLASDYVAYFIFPAQLLFLLMQKNWEIVKKWFTALVFSILLGIWWLPHFLNQIDVGAVASANLPAWREVLGSFDAKAIPLTFVKFIIGRISYPDKLIYALILLPIILLFLWLLYNGIRTFKTLERNFVLSWLIIPIVLASLVSLFIPIYSYFRLLFVLPAFIILVAAGILFYRAKLKYSLMAVSIVFFFSTLVYLFNPTFQREDWRGLVNFLKSKDGIVLFESSAPFAPFDYYAKGEINAKGALKDFPAKTAKNIIDLEEESKIYLVEYLVEIADPQRLVSKKLQDLGFKQKEIFNFSGVGFVYHYVR